MPRWVYALGVLPLLSVFIASSQTEIKAIEPDEAAAHLIKHVEPVYPPLAIAARLQGIVEFNFTITESRTVADIKLVRGHPLLVSPAKEALEQWTYKPLEDEGRAIPVRTSIDIPFRLNKDSGQ